MAEPCTKTILNSFETSQIKSEHSLKKFIFKPQHGN